MRKQQLIRFNVHSVTRLSLALCTVLALSAAPSRADDVKDKDKGAPGAASKSQAGQSSRLGQEEEKFVRKAAMSGMIETRMGQLAVERAQNPQVKQFGQRLVDDHKKASQELRQIAASKGMNLPDPGDQIAGVDPDADRTLVREGSEEDKDKAQFRDRTPPGAAREHAEHSEHRAMLKKLGSLSGTDFDREFVQAAVKHHQKDVSEFEKASEKCEDTELKAWIDKTLPTLRDHLQTAQRLQAQVGGTTGRTSNYGESNTGAPGTQSDQDAGSNEKKP